MSHRKDISKRKRKTSRYKPYSMTNPGDVDLEGFVATGRTGRRNALPDIMDEKVTKTSTSDLPEGLDKLSFATDEKESVSAKDEVKVKPDDKSSSSSSSPPPPKDQKEKEKS